MSGDGRYFGSFHGYEYLSCFDERDSDYNNIVGSYPKDEQILFAAYGGRAYEGSALVVFEDGGKVFEVNGGHCSCNGLEGQWGAEETTWEALAKRTLDPEEYEADAIAAFTALVASRTQEPVSLDAGVRGGGA